MSSDSSAKLLDGMKVIVGKNTSIISRFNAECDQSNDEPEEHSEKPSARNNIFANIGTSLYH